MTSFSGNELATVPIAVVCIALPIRVTLTDAKIRTKLNLSTFAFNFIQPNNNKTAVLSLLLYQFHIFVNELS